MKKLFIAIGLILSFLAVTSVQSFTVEDKIYGCVSKKWGRLRIVSNCNKCLHRWEQCISWNVEGPQGEGCLKVYSANDEFVGILVNFTKHVTEISNTIVDPNMLVYIPSLGKFFQFNIPYGGNIYQPLIRKPTIYFETSNCTGTPYIKRNELYREELMGLAYIVV